MIETSATSPKNILLIDDDQDDIILFQETLEIIDPRVRFVAATNGRAALEALQQPGAILPDAIFLDLNMPLLNGPQCLAVLKNDPLLNAVPVVMLSTSSQTPDIEMTLNMGAVCFVKKPNNLQDLQKLIIAILNGIPDSIALNLSKLKAGSATEIFVKY